MLPDWKANRVYVSGLLPVRHPQLWQGLVATFRQHRIDYHLLDGTKDIWCKDYLPVQVSDSAFIKFRYEPDYLRHGYGHLITGREICGRIMPLGKVEFADLILDGGNIVTATNRVIVTDKVYKENPTRQRHEIRSRLEAFFQAGCIIIPKEPYDFTGHADGIVTFIDENVVLLNDYSKIDRGYGRRVRAVLKEHHLDVEEMPYFIGNRGADDATGNYVNQLRVGDLIVIPAYEAPLDDRALKKLESLCPTATVVPLSCKELAREGGVLHCCTTAYYTPSKGTETS
jgi:agmatine/peptidylarginine deiminase